MTAERPAKLMSMAQAVRRAPEIGIEAPTVAELKLLREELDPEELYL